MAVHINSKSYLHHSYSRGTGNARHFLNQQNRRPQTGQSPTCLPTSPAGGVCPPPRPQAECQGSCLEMALECPYGSPLDTEASLSEPFCRDRSSNVSLKRSQRTASFRVTDAKTFIVVAKTVQVIVTISANH